MTVLDQQPLGAISTLVMVLVIFSRMPYSALGSFSGLWTGQAFSSIYSCSACPWLSTGAAPHSPCLQQLCLYSLPISSRRPQLSGIFSISILCL